MKTLVINGTTRKNGDTEALLNEFLRHLPGEHLILSQDSNIAPCKDCRYCWSHEGCCVKDDMQAAYEYLRDCDNVVIASPIWFSTISSVALAIGSRVQMLYAQNAFFGKPFEIKTPKNGVLFLTGGEPSTATAAAPVARTIMKFMGVQRPLAAEVSSLLTNDLPARDDAKALQAARDAAETLARLFQ